MRRSATRQRALAAGYRSGLEEEMAENLKERGITFTYEEEKIKWLDSKVRTYTPELSYTRVLKVPMRTGVIVTASCTQIK